MRRFFASLALAALTIGPASAQPGKRPELIIADNDYLGPGGSNIQSLIPLLNNPKVKVLGLTVVVGDDWENAESLRVRRFLEISGHRDVPVFDGATQPLINTVALTRLREKQYGALPWKGAWGGQGSMDNTPDTQPVAAALTPDGMPSLQPQGIPAALFMIQQVHAHPHQVTIIECGPMTNLALAIRLDPTFANTAKQLIFMGGYLDLTMTSVTGNADNSSDFNLIFDPEAAHITLTAPWPRITSIANVSNDVTLSKSDVEAIARSHQTPVTEYLVKYYAPLAMWDEVTSAIAADPSLVTKFQDAYMDVEIAKGLNYGHAHVWPDSLAPTAMGVRKIRIVQSIDTTRFKTNYANWAKDFMGIH